MNFNVFFQSVFITMILCFPGSSYFLTASSYAVSILREIASALGNVPVVSFWAVEWICINFLFQVCDVDMIIINLHLQPSLQMKKLLHVGPGRNAGKAALLDGQRVSRTPSRHWALASATKRAKIRHLNIFIGVSENYCDINLLASKSL